MKRTFIRTKNVKRFVGLMEELQKLPPNIPKLALVFGEHGLGKSQTIQWWADKNDSVYVRANQGMTSRWLLSEIAEELGEEPYWHTQETFELIENHLRNNPKTIIVDDAQFPYKNVFLSSDGSTILCTDTKNRVNRANYFYADKSTGWKLTPTADLGKRTALFGPTRLADDGSYFVIYSDRGLDLYRTR